MLRHNYAALAQKNASDVKEIGCVMNPHDTCAVDKIINSKKRTLTPRACDAKYARVSPKENDEFAIR